jgi:predicted hotdog family 3-hydroxylacyl-ACP dehydratase
MDLLRFLPHGPPLRLLTGIDAVGDDHVQARGLIPRDAPGATEHGVPAILGIELGAQSTAMIAAAAIAAVGESPTPRLGYLVSLRAVTLHVPFLPTGVELRVAARRIGGAGGFEMFEVAVRRPGEVAPAVEGVVGTLLTDQKIALGT